MADVVVVTVTNPVRLGCFTEPTRRKLEFDPPKHFVPSTTKEKLGKRKTNKKNSVNTR